MNAQSWIRQILHKRRIPFNEVHYPEGFTSQDVAQKAHVTGHRVAKVVIVIADGRPIELVLPATRHIVVNRVRKVLAARDVRLATERELEQYFADVDPGAIPPLRRPQWHDVPVIMDETMKVEGELLIQAGTRTDGVRLRFDDWFKLVTPRVERFSAEDNAVHSAGRQKNVVEKAMIHTSSDFETTLHATNVWLADLADRLGTSDRHEAYIALRAVLHALRDRLSVEHVAALSAQLPMLVRGFFFEGWHPFGKPLKDRKEQDFLDHVDEHFRGAPDIDARLATHAVFSLLKRHVTRGEIESLRATLPHELKRMWT